MRCPRCQRESLVGAEYCVRCGAPLFGGQGAGASGASADGLSEMRRQLKEMGLRLSVVEGRVMVISERMGLDIVQPLPLGSGPGPVRQESMAPPAEAKPEVSPVAAYEPPAADTMAFPETVAAPAPVPQPPAAPETPPPAASEPLLSVLASDGGEPVTASAAETDPGQAAADTAEVTAVPGQPAADTPAVTAVPREPAGAIGRVAVVPQQGPTAPAAAARPPKEPPAPRGPSPFARKMREWEQALPGNWLSRIGMLALFIGLGFLAKLAYDQGWVGPVTQLLAGLGCGALFLLAGHHWRQVYRGWAQALTGGGIGILYLSVFGSYGLHHLMPFLGTFVLMFLVTLLAVGIALRRDSMSIAILGIVGAFLVPITLGAIDQSGDGAGSTGGGSNTGLMAAYILTLDVAVVGLASRRSWRWFTLLGFGGSMAVFGLWYGTTDRESALGAAEGLLTGIFLCFAAATTLFHGLKTHRPQLTDLALMTLNAAVYFGVTHYILWEDYRGWLGMIGFGLAGFYALMGYMFLRRSRENRLLSAFAFSIAIIFLTVAIPVQLQKSWMTAAWAAEGAVLIWLAVRYGTPRWQLWGLGALALAVIRLFAFDQFVDWRHGFTPVMNDMFWAFAPTALALAAAAWFLRQREKSLHPHLFPIMVLSANFLAVWLASFETIHFAGSRIWAANGGAAGYDARAVENARNLLLVALWGLYGLALVYWGARRSWAWLRPAGYVLVAMAVGATLAVLNYQHAMVTAGRSMPIINYSFGALAVCAGVLGLVAVMLRRYGERMMKSEKGAFPAVVSAASVLGVYALSAEVFAFITDPLNARHLVLVALWAACGLGVMIVGLRRGWAWLRVQGWLLGLMAIGAAMMTLNYGRFLMEEGPAHPIGNYSFGAFAICTGMAAALAGLVARSRERLAVQERALFPALVLLANFLALWSVSSEVITFMHGADNGRSLVLVFIWAAWGLALLRAGIWKQWDWMRVAAWLMAAVAIGATLILLNHRSSGVRAGTDYLAILNPSLGGFAVCVAGLYLYSYLITRHVEELHQLESTVRTVALAGASVLTLWGLSEEIVAFIDPDNLRNLLLVLLWMGYGCGLMMLGVVRKALLPRIGAVALLALGVAATTAILNHWVAGIERGRDWPILNYSFGAFAACTAASLLFARTASRAGGEAQGFDRAVTGVALGAANVLTIVALSSELITFVPGANLRNLLLVLLWTGYGCGLMTAGVLRRALPARAGGVLLLALGVGATMALLNHWQAGIQRGQDWPVLNYSFGAFTACVAAAYVFAWLLARMREEAGGFDRAAAATALAAASVLTVWALSAEVVTFVADTNVRSLVLVMVWSGYGLLVMAAGSVRAVPAARFAGYALVAAAIAMAVAMLNHGRPGLQGPGSRPIINAAFGGWLVCVAALYLAAWTTARNSSRLLDFEKTVLTMAIVAANALSLIALSSEVWTYAGGDEGMGKTMGLTLLWAAYGLAMMVAGIIGRSPRVRLGGLALVSVAVAKLFLYDMVKLGGGYRVAAFVITGILLLAGGFVYHRYADVIKGFIMDRPGKGARPDRR